MSESRFQTGALRYQCANHYYIVRFGLCSFEKRYFQKQPQKFRTGVLPTFLSHITHIDTQLLCQYHG
jgi:hypothetical protein